MTKPDDFLDEATGLKQEQEVQILFAFRRGRRGERYRMLVAAKKVVSRWRPTNPLRT